MTEDELRYERQAAAVERLRRISRLMDSNFTVPGTKYTFGLDPIIGLIPGVGDVASFLISAYPLLESRNLDLKKGTMARMIANIGIDALIGLIPVVGDLFDFVYKANKKNFAIVEKHHARTTVPKPPPRKLN